MDTRFKSFDSTMRRLDISFQRLDNSFQKLEQNISAKLDAMISLLTQQQPRHQDSHFREGLLPELVGALSSMGLQPLRPMDTFRYAPQREIDSWASDKQPEITDGVCSLALADITGEVVPHIALVSVTGNSVSKLEKIEYKLLPMMDEEVTVNFPKDHDLHQDMEDFLFLMLGDAGKLNRDAIHKVLCSLGYDLHKSMEKLLALSAITLAIRKDSVFMSSGLSDLISRSESQGTNGYRDNANNTLKTNGIESTKHYEATYDFQQEVLAAFFDTSIPRIEESSKKNFQCIQRSAVSRRFMTRPPTDTDILIGMILNYKSTRKKLFILPSNSVSSYELRMLAPKHIILPNFFLGIFIMIEIVKLLGRNDVPLQFVTVDVVFRICYNTKNVDLMTKYSQKFSMAGIKLHQTSYVVWLDFASKIRDVESLWKIENLSSESMKQHTLVTGFSCAKGFLLEWKLKEAAAILELLYGILAGKDFENRRGSFGSKKMKKDQNDESPYDIALENCKSDCMVESNGVAASLKKAGDSECDDNFGYFIEKKLLVWCHLPNGKWAPGTIPSTTGEEAVVLLSKGDVIKVPTVQLLTGNPFIWEGVDSLIQLRYVNEPSVHNLRQEFSQDKIYSKAGPVLIAINPFKDVSCNENDVVMVYRQKLVDSPYIYATIDTAYNQMMSDGINLSIIISEESGAGRLGLEDGIVQTNYMLEAFGNAKTSRNNNYSRFGKLIEVHSSTLGNICGAKIQTFLLKKSKVVQLAKTRDRTIYFVNFVLEPNHFLKGD